jgi:hypothetical protein
MMTNENSRRARKVWNRSSSLTPEELGLFNVAMSGAISGAIQRLAVTMSPEELKTVVDVVSATARKIIEETLFPETLFPEMAAYEKRESISKSSRHIRRVPAGRS